jgi:biopolymer transport protein ExbD
MARTALFETDPGEEPLTPPKRQIDGEMDITPLIDCVFLLLIFFMVTSTMQGTPDVDVPFAHYGTGVPGRNATIVTLRNPPPADLGPPLVILGDGRGPQADFAELKTYVEEGLRNERNHVIIKAERTVPHGFVQEVARVVSGIEGIRFNIGVQEKR